MDKDGISIVFEDDCVIVIKKPAGLATQSSDIRQIDCVTFIKDHIKRENPTLRSEPYVGVIHRLDQPVEGLLVFTKDKKSAAELSRQLQSDMMNKHYHALVEGIVDVPSDTKLTGFIYRDKKSGRAFMCDPASAPSDAKIQEASLIYRTEKIHSDKDKTILSIKLETGRFHQIRAQLSDMGHPIVGDRKYGSTVPYPKGIALIADRLEFTHPRSGEKVEKIVDFSFRL